MPNCYKCGARIFFLTKEPTRYDPKPRAHPIDVDPDPARGDLAIYQWPGIPPGNQPPEVLNRPQKLYFRKQFREALEFLRRRGVTLYRSHLDSCPR